MHVTDSRQAGTCSSAPPPPPSPSYRRQVLGQWETVLTRLLSRHLGIGIYGSPSPSGSCTNTQPVPPSHFRPPPNNAFLISFRFRRCACSRKVVATRFSPRRNTAHTNLTANRPGFGDFRTSTAKKFYQACDSWSIGKTKDCCTAMQPSGQYHNSLCHTIVLAVVVVDVLVFAVWVSRADDGMAHFIVSLSIQRARARAYGIVYRG